MIVFFISVSPHDAAGLESRREDPIAGVLLDVRAGHDAARRRAAFEETSRPSRRYRFAARRGQQRISLRGSWLSPKDALARSPARLVISSNNRIQVPTSLPCS